MIKKLKLLTLVVFSTTNILFGQTISNIDFDLIKSKTQDSTSTYYYPLLLERFLQFDTTLTDKEFSMIYYGNVFHPKYNPYGSGEHEDKFMEKFNKEKFREAIPLGEKELFDNPVNLKVLYRMLVCYHKLGDKTTAKKYANLYFGLLDEIYKSGNGKSIKTAYVVIKVSDEYVILSDLKLTRKKQRLVGDTDILTIETKGQKPIKGKKKIKELYFNVTKPLDYLQEQFRKKE